MPTTQVNVTVPALPEFARSVRMMAANLAVVCHMSVDDVEDVRMAAEEGFVYTCATRPQTCDITFTLETHCMSMDFCLGTCDFREDTSQQDFELVNLMLNAVCDACYETDEHTLHLEKSFGGVHVE